MNPDKRMELQDEIIQLIAENAGLGTQIVALQTRRSNMEEVLRKELTSLQSQIDRKQGFAESNRQAISELQAELDAGKLLPVGTRVEFTHRDGQAGPGDTGIITEVDDDDTDWPYWVTLYNDKTVWTNTKYFEVLPVAAPSAFTVGQRVEIVDCAGLSSVCGRHLGHIGTIVRTYNDYFYVLVDGYPGTIDPSYTYSYKAEDLKAIPAALKVGDRVKVIGTAQGLVKEFSYVGCEATVMYITAHTGAIRAKTDDCGHSGLYYPQSSLQLL